jgi:chromosome transmission fidelity protein 18
MAASGIRFDRIRLDSEGVSHSSGPQTWVFRMEPAVDELSIYETFDSKAAGVEKVDRARFAVRQVLSQEFSLHSKKTTETARVARGGIVSLTDAVAGATLPNLSRDGSKKAKRDFFGRVVAEEEDKEGDDEAAQQKRKRAKLDEGGDKERVWVTFHEGYSNAVRKPVSLGELVGGL